jgi:hypothetical protein
VEVVAVWIGNVEAAVGAAVAEKGLCFHLFFFFLGVR